MFLVSKWIEGAVGATLVIIFPTDGLLQATIRSLCSLWKTEEVILGEEVHVFLHVITGVGITLLGLANKEL